MIFAVLADICFVKFVVSFAIFDDFVSEFHEHNDLSKFSKSPESSKFVKFQICVNSIRFHKIPEHSAEKVGRYAEI